MQKETIYYRGIAFTRYPEAKTRSERVYYSGRAIINGKSKKIRLHVYKWMCEVGEIPDKYAIHHKDENPLNNELSNLECVESKKHMSNHMSTDERKQKSHVIMETLARPKAIEWHKSEISTPWHKEHVKNSLFKTEITAKCEECGIEFTTKAKRGEGKKYFCCTKHQWKYQARIARARKSEIGICPTCGVETYGQKYCSFECYTSRSV